MNKLTILMESLWPGRRALVLLESWFRYKLAASDMGWLFRFLFKFSTSFNILLSLLISSLAAYSLHSIDTFKHGQWYLLDIFVAVCEFRIISKFKIKVFLYKNEWGKQSRVINIKNDLLRATVLFKKTTTTTTKKSYIVLSELYALINVLK